ncbi:glycoside hydrolase family 3 N-terminal domain-containing protein [Novosphingobium bradum]|uniref:Glycoside hydrolase family 3 N-terminal domain-containing protein n=1 Tax=Novosphingobium bradum TaxID=1737444 RepID=A0ABV7IS94_9SPHN
MRRLVNRGTISAAIMMATLVSQGASAQTRAPAQGQPASQATIAARADALIAQMTPEEKAAQLVTYFYMGQSAASDQRVKNGAGSFLFLTDPKEINRLQRVSAEQSRLKIPLLFGFDVVHGLSTIFPVPIGQAASWDPALAERNQAVAAAEARAVGLHWAFAPMVDIARDPRWGRMVEGAGEDPYLGAAMAAAQVRGFQGADYGAPGRIIAGPKHFAAYGAALGGRDYDEVNVADAELWNVYFPPFKAAIDAGAGNIMSAYMGINGIPAPANHWLLTDVLRQKWGFKGWVVSDAQAVINLKTHGLTADGQGSATQALNSGLDMEMAFAAPAFANLPKALAAGQTSQATIDAAVRRLLEAKLRLGLFEHPYVDEARADKVLRSPAHLEAARIAAERSAVLLRNEGGLLPLDRRKLRAVAVIGGLADSPQDSNGPWVFAQNKPATQSLLEGLRAKLGNQVTVTYAPGVKLPIRTNPSQFDAMGPAVKRPEPLDDTTGIAEAVKAAQGADVAIVVVGEAQNMIGEQASRSTLDLPGRQQELLDAVVATGKPVVVVLLNGRPLDLKGTKAQAILDMWYPGSRGGTATANLLLGDAVPGGKLPFTWPRNVGQVPLTYAHLASHDPANVAKRYWNEAGTPAYPFGHGLSYSTFAYSGLSIDKAQIAPGGSVTVSAEVTNTGTRTADEVAQLYIHQRTGTAARPVRELKGFTRVTLKPGEVRKLTFRLGPDELRYWNAAARDWVSDEAVFDVAVGTDSTAAFGASFAVKAGS